MSPVEVPLSFHVALAPQPGSVENARQILANGCQLVEQESGTLQWFAYQLDDKEDGSPGGFGAFGTCTDAAAREAHINGPFLRSLTTSTELFAGKPEIRPVETLCFKTTPTEGRSPSLGARVVIKAKPKSVHKIKRTLTGQYFDDVKEETRTAFWYAFQADETTFGLFAAFFSDEDRTTHLNGHGMWHMMDEIALSMEGIKSVKFPIVAFKA